MIIFWDIVFFTHHVFKKIFFVFLISKFQIKIFTFLRQQGFELIISKKIFPNYHSILFHFDAGKSRATKGIDIFDALAQSGEIAAS